MICVSSVVIQEKASHMPAAYLEDCKKVALVRNSDGMWCFTAPDFFAIRKKYRTFVASDATQKLESRIIRGCCGESAKTKPL